MSTTKRINQKKVDQIGYQRGRWAIYLFLAIVVVCQLLPFYLAINASMKPQTDMSSTLMPRLHDIAWDNWTPPSPMVRSFIQWSTASSLLYAPH